jgi:cytochrome c-type biogenesis protein CcmH/NrfG
MLGVACDLRPKDWRSFFFLGYAECRRAKFEPQRYVAAEAALGKARELAPREPLVLRFYAYAKSFSGIKLTPGADLSAAAQAVQQAIAARPEQAPNYHLLTQVRLAQGDSAGAIAAARKAVALNADDGYSLYLLAKALVASRGDQAIGGGDQRVAEAKALLTRSMALDPGLMDESQTAPHAGLLISILLGEGNVQAAEALTNWCVQNGFGQ